jgi:hypothetical protein
MKLVFITIITIFSSIGMYSQQLDSSYCFSRSDILLLANKIQLIKDSVRYKADIIKSQDSLISLYKEGYLVYKNQLENKNTQISLLEEQNILLNKSIDLVKPKWYDNKWLWFGNGVLVTAIIVSLIK